MATIAAAAPSLNTVARASEDAVELTIEIADSVEAAEGPWRDLEAGAIMSPYGRYDWVAAYAASMLEEGSVKVVIARDGAGRVALVQPIAVERRLGISTGTAPGGKHVNFNVPLVRPDVAARLTPERATRLLRTIGQSLAVDLLAFVNVPAEWGGRPNPFAAGGQAAPSDAWAVHLETDGLTTLARSMSAEARKKLRNKTRGIAKLGPVELLQARQESDVDFILDAFYRQKEMRFRDLGISDPFAEPGMQRFIREGALRHLPEGRPAIELYGLTVAGRVVGVLGGAGDRLRLSGMFVSFDTGETAKFSPGEIMVTEVIRAQCERGRATFDLGVGDARYKRSICDTCERLVDVTVPVTVKGRLHGAARSGLVALKRRVKANPRAMAMVSRARKELSRLRP